MESLAMSLFHYLTYRLLQLINLTCSLLNMDGLLSLYKITSITSKHNEIQRSYSLKVSNPNSLSNTQLQSCSRRNPNLLLSLAPYFIPSNQFYYFEVRSSMKPRWTNFKNCSILSPLLVPGLVNWFRVLVLS